MSSNLRKLISGACAALILSGGFAHADEQGRKEFYMACATCHGDTGRGDGSMAEFMSEKLPDLTTLAARNGGKFPMLELVHIIDGRTGLRGHGSQMPVWGDRFSQQAATDASGDYSNVYAARGKILSIVLYLETLQE